MIATNANYIPTRCSCIGVCLVKFFTAIDFLVPNR